METKYAFLLDGVSREGLAVKDGVRGWWCEGEFLGDGLTPLIVVEEGRVVACIRPPCSNAGALVATAAGRLPIFSTESSLPTNVFFKNLLEFCRQARSRSKKKTPADVFVHSGNWSHRSFLKSEMFGARFTGMHWGCLDDSVLEGVRSVWIPWDSNIRALRQRWPLLERAVAKGTALVIEDMRGDWLPGFHWEQRPVDSVLVQPNLENTAR